MNELIQSKEIAIGILSTTYSITLANGKGSLSQKRVRRRMYYNTTRCYPIHMGFGYVVDMYEY